MGWCRDGRKKGDVVFGRCQISLMFQRASRDKASAAIPAPGLRHGNDDAKR